jgi:propanol-preferring alcohol dehydrogenase
MDAFRYHGVGDVRVERVPTPSPRPGGVLVEVKAAALCHTELHFRDGTLDLGVRPITLGHEAAGLIAAVGDGVEPSRVGERVLVYYYVGCGKCAFCAAGDEQLCGELQAELGFISDGGLARYVVAPARNALPLPPSLPFEQAAPIGCGVSTAVHAAKRAGGLRAGETVVVYGCNGVGHSIVQLACHRGCTVIAIARKEAHLRKAAELGAHIQINGADASTVGSAVRAATGGKGADVIFECVGRRETMDACVGWAGALGKRGRLVLVGYAQGEAHDFRAHPIPLIVYEQSIIGTVGATLDDVREAIELVAAGAIVTVVDSTISLKNVVKEGLDRIEACACVGKIVVDRFECGECVE